MILSNFLVYPHTRLLKKLVWGYTKTMQKIATRAFIYASIAFGIIGILLVLSNEGDNSEPNQTLMRMLLATVFIILPSFALSVASKYLNDKS